MKGYTIVDADEFVIDHREEAHDNPGPEKMHSRLNIPKELGEFKLEGISSRHFSLHHLTLTCNHNLLLRSSGTNKSKYAIAWMTSGKDNVSFEEADVPVAAGNSVFLLNPTEVEIHRFEPERKNETYFLEITPEYFEETFLKDDIFKDGVVLNKLRHASSTNKFAFAESPLHSLQTKIVADIYRCPLQGALGEMMLEGSVQQIIALQLSSLASGSKKQISIRTHDREIIQAVREHLDSTFERDHTLHDLSRMFGINSGKLKKLFKELVGVPVIQYLYDLKMNHAQTLLRDNAMNVSEVAYKIGYRHAHHFTAAFKKKFGVSPSRLR
jgi:AraC-like DNA-binding protein